MQDLPSTNRYGYACLKCGGIGTIPSHRLDCQAHDAGALVIATPFRAARSFLEQMDATYVAEAANSLASQIRIDLQQAIEQIRSLLQLVDQAAIGALG